MSWFPGHDGFPIELFSNIRAKPMLDMCNKAPKTGILPHSSLILKKGQRPTWLWQLQAHKHVPILPKDWLQLWLGVYPKVVKLVHSNPKLIHNYVFLSKIASFIACLSSILGNKYCSSSFYYTSQEILALFDMSTVSNGIIYLPLCIDLIQVRALLPMSNSCIHLPLPLFTLMTSPLSCLTATGDQAGVPLIFSGT